MCSSSDSSTLPARSNGGAANASPSAVGRMLINPAAHSWMITSAELGDAPVESHAWQVPRVGCPANGSSATGVKIRTR